MNNRTESVSSQELDLPESPWLLSMKWHDVLFLHWPIPVDQLEPHVPDELALETFDGTGWLGIVPFTMSGIRPRFVPPMPFVSNFPEINIRTYVNDGERSGVWFFSLDASSWLAVQAARITYSLNYFHADMDVTVNDGTVDYYSRRKDSESGTFHFDGEYNPTDNLGEDRTEFEEFLTERYYLFSSDDDGNLYYGAIHHDPWELFHADHRLETMEIRGHPSPPDEPPASVLYSPYQDVRAWLPKST
jgi:hypothetical protein